jgi:hypothetical protein
LFWAGLLLNFFLADVHQIVKSYFFGSGGLCFAAMQLLGGLLA